MEQKLIVKNNKMIVEFMDMSIDFDSKNQPYLAKVVQPYVKYCKGQPIRPWETDFDVSWDWLMPVIKKCEETGADEYEGISVALDSLDIDSTYSAVVEFIKWYNSKEHKPKKYMVCWSKTYTRTGSLEVSAVSEKDAHNKVYEMIGNLEGSLHYHPDEDKIEVILLKEV